MTGFCNQIPSDDILVWGGIFPTHFFGHKNPSFFDHFLKVAPKIQNISSMI
jgi:hypothetical protein